MGWLSSFYVLGNSDPRVRGQAGLKAGFTGAGAQPRLFQVFWLHPRVCCHSPACQTHFSFACGGAGSHRRDRQIDTAPWV